MKGLRNFKFETVVQPLRLAKWDVNDKVLFYRKGRKYTYHEFERLANKSARQVSCSSINPPEYMEKVFWHEMAHGKRGTVEYGVSIDGSAFSCDPNEPLGKSKWNLKNLPRLRRSILRLVDRVIPGITYPMLFAMFTWHVEDHYLYSINYHHSGAPKTWYGVPGYAALQFESVAHNHVFSRDILAANGKDGAFALLSRKTTIFPPSILLENTLPVYKAEQMPGEFVVTFPRAYHAGFSHGFNCGEAVNFATGDWFPIGVMASQRYAVLNKFPIIPFEELLYNEAMLLFNYSRQKDYADTFTDSVSQHSIKVAFVPLIELHKQALWRLKVSPTFPHAHGTPECSLCKRDSYLAYNMCNCCYDPICLFHELNSLYCSCGNERTIFLREDLSAMDDAAGKFMRGEDMLLELHQGTSFGDDMQLKSSKLWCIKDASAP